jgi:hypothetical protein
MVYIEPIVVPNNSHILLIVHILLTQKCVQNYFGCVCKSFWLLILDTPEHVDSENIKLKIGPRTFLYQLFCIKLAKIDQKSKVSIFLKNSFLFSIRSKTVSNVFHDLKNVKIAEKSSVNFNNFSHIF